MVFRWTDVNEFGHRTEETNVEAFMREFSLFQRSFAYRVLRRIIFFIFFVEVRDDMPDFAFLASANLLLEHGYFRKIADEFFFDFAHFVALVEWVYGSLLFLDKGFDFDFGVSLSLAVDDDFGDHLPFEGLSGFGFDFEDGGAERVFADAFGFEVVEEQVDGDDPLLAGEELC